MIQRIIQLTVNAMTVGAVAGACLGALVVPAYLLADWWSMRDIKLPAGA